MRIVVLGLSVTSSWGNGHSTTYRALLRGLHQCGHSLLFLERDKPWYRENRDLPQAPYMRVELYEDLQELRLRFTAAVTNADLVIVGSYVPEGVAVSEWVLANARGIAAFYDIDTPVTLAKLERGDEEYIAARLIPRFAIYLSFTGGPILRSIERDFGARMARALYCSVDPDLYFPEPVADGWLLGYLGTYSADRQPALDRLLLAPARHLPNNHFVVAGPMYPAQIDWPENIETIPHLAPDEHRRFYNAQRFTLNVTRADMVKAGYSPSVRLFEAAACGTPIISDDWPGLDTLFVPGEEILIARSTGDMLGFLTDFTALRRADLSRRARERVLREHTARHRAIELERHLAEFRGLSRSATATGGSSVTAARQRNDAQ